MKGRSGREALAGLRAPIIKTDKGTSQVVQWLRLCTSTAGGMGLIPGRGTEMLHAAWRGQKKSKKSKIDQLERNLELVSPMP